MSGELPAPGPSSLAITPMLNYMFLYLQKVTIYTPLWVIRVNWLQFIYMDCHKLITFFLVLILSLEKYKKK